MSKERTKPETLREKALEELDSAMQMQVSLSENDASYDLFYISGKLAQVSSYLERLANISANLTRISLDVTRQVHELKSLFGLKERQYRQDSHYLNGDRMTKGDWLKGKLEVLNSELEDWSLTSLYLKEVREAINDRIQLMKRLDSDIRLQQKLLEAKVIGGALGRDPVGFSSGSSTGIAELDLD